jgi:hypothetical protein
MAKAPGKEPQRFVDHTQSPRILRTEKGDSAKHRHAPYTKGKKTDRILVNGVPWTPPKPLSFILSPEALEATKEIVDRWRAVLENIFTTRFATPTQAGPFPVYLFSQAIVMAMQVEVLIKCVRLGAVPNSDDECYEVADPLANTNLCYGGMGKIQVVSGAATMASLREGWDALRHRLDSGNIACSYYSVHSISEKIKLFVSNIDETHKNLIFIDRPNPERPWLGNTSAYLLLGKAKDAGIIANLDAQVGLFV